MLRQIILLAGLGHPLALAVPAPISVRIGRSHSLAIEVELDRRLPNDRTESALILDHAQIMFDVRNVRGGNGDVAAALLMAQDLRSRFAFKGAITFIVTPRARKIFEMLKPNFSAAGPSPVRLIDALDIPPDLAPADIYIELSAARGRPVNESRYQNTEITNFARRSDQIPVHGGTIFVTVPVFSASEDLRKFDSRIALTYRGILFEGPPPGPASNEAGVYHDPSAVEIRDADVDRRGAIIEEELTGIRNPRIRSELRRLIFQTKRTMAFVYGVSHSATRAQFTSYLKGLIDEPGLQFLVITPSGVASSDSAAINRSDLQIFASNDTGWETSEAKVVVVQIPGISNRLFNSLLARSAAPPIVAGDNALSAVQLLGRPYVMTQVAWNAPIVKSVFGDLILRSPEGLVREVLAEVLEQNLSRAFALRDSHGIYRASAGRVRNLTEVLFAIVDRVRDYVDREAPEISASDLKQNENRALNVHLLLRQLVEGSQKPFAPEDFNLILVMGLGIGIQRATFSPRELAHPVITEYLNRGLDRVLTDAEENFAGAAQIGAPGLIESFESKLKIHTERARHVEGPMLNDRLGYASVANATRIIDALDAIGTARAYALIVDYGLHFPYHSVVSRSRHILLNHWGRTARPDLIASLIDQMTDDDVSWFAQFVTDNTYGDFTRPEVLRHLLTHLPEGQLHAPHLRARLNRYEDTIDCADELGGNLKSGS